MAEEQTHPFESDLETARMRLRNLAEDACKALDARMLNLASFHLCAYMDFATKHKGHLVKIMMSEIEAEQLNALVECEANRKADPSAKPVERSGREAAAVRGEKPGAPKVT